MILYSAASSYYSMVARLALLEAGAVFSIRRMDIHIAKEQLSQWYMELNPKMTVPTLVNGEQILTDSSYILDLSAQLAGPQWMDSDNNLQPSIDKIVRDFYSISIEDLTFAKAMVKFPPLHFIFPRILAGVIKKLNAELKTSKDVQAIRDKIALNQRRIEYFTTGSLLDKLNIERAKVSHFLSTLPSPNNLFFGDKPSSADVVVAVLLGRLMMVGEYDLVAPYPNLAAWFTRMQDRPAFKQADIWLKFQPLRILLRK